MHTDRTALPGPLMLLAASLVILCAAATAWCHGISVFAWVEGERVFVEGKFSGGKRPVGATVRVFGPEGAELLSGATDAQGGWAFDLPQRTALRIVLEAGMGHRGEWTLSAEEAGAPSSTAVGDEKPPSHPPTLSTAAPPAVTPADDLDTRLRKIVSTELAPLAARLARLEARLDRPSFKDILGGLGYILGLVGIGAYVQARRKRNEMSGNGTNP